MTVSSMFGVKSCLKNGRLDHPIPGVNISRPSSFLTECKDSPRESKFSRQVATSCCQASCCKVHSALRRWQFVCLLHYKIYCTHKACIITWTLTQTLPWHGHKCPPGLIARTVRTLTSYVSTSALRSYSICFTYSTIGFPRKRALGGKQQRASLSSCTTGQSSLSLCILRRRKKWTVNKPRKPPSTCTWTCTSSRNIDMVVR